MSDKCGSTTNLQVDHIDPKEKLYNVCLGWSGRPWNVLALELAKCQLLCVPHHKEKTRLDAELHNRWRYLKWRCRCGECKADYSIYRKQRWSTTKT